MFRSRHYLVVWALVLANIVYTSRSSQEVWNPAQCPKLCVCRLENSAKRVYCDIRNKQDLTAVPANFPVDSEFISLGGNRISTIPVGAFSNLRQLRYLNLPSNGLHSLPMNVFRGLRSLETLNLANNRLNILPSGLFKGLSSLRNLYLDGNVIENLPNDFFVGLTSLKRLFLHRNKLQTFPERALGFRLEFRDLRINHNKLTTITPATLRNYTSLVTLTLSHNAIRQVHNGSFNQMATLKQLKLNDNNISTLPRGLFRGMKSLSLLSLYNNPFECTCGLKWLKHWILRNKRTVTVFHSDRIICHGPLRLRDKALITVKDEEFGCKREQWTQWSSWSNCSKPCGIGRQSRTRDCIGEYGRTKCEGFTKNWRVCNTHSCESQWSEWGSWSPCSVTCSFGHQRRSRETKCERSPCQKQIESVVRVCVRGKCPSYSEWSSWSMCDAVCGLGRQKRSRICSSSRRGRPCSGPEVNIRECKIRECAEWTAWSEWSACSKSCSQGMQSRMRDCIVVFGTKKECSGNGTDERRCSLRECPVDGGWSPWQSWSSCSKTCGLGFKMKQRNCSSPPPQHGGASCKGSNVEVTQCVESVCGDSDLSEFTPWSDWSKCSAQCGKGIQVRSRSCTKLDPVSGIGMCLGNREAFRECQMHQCNTEGFWGKWSTWSECWGNCNVGQRFRSRTCVGRHGFSGYRCTNNQTYEFQRESCQPTSCSYKPVWSTWSNWSECSKTCDKGTRRRKRFCLTRAIGQECWGHYESKDHCNTFPCPVHGGWSAWSDWGECNRPCGGGIQQRNRTCTNPTPHYDGRECVGDKFQIIACGLSSCPGTNVLSDGLPQLPTPITLESPKDCPKPQTPKNGKYVLRKQRDEYKYLEYRCNEFFRNRGLSTFRHCMSTGEWSGVEADCVLDCGEIGKNASNKKRLVKDDSIKSLKESWPWQAAIEVYKRGVICGGSLVDDEWIVTAAHCVLKARTKIKHEGIRVYLGTYDVKQQSHSRPEMQVIPVSEVHYHEDFGWTVYDSDIAVLKLERKVQITSSVHPVCLPKSRRRKQLLRAGNMGVMVGWGSEENPYYLRQIPLPVVDHSTCQKSYSRKGWKVTKNMLCAGYKSKRRDTCKRDSGGGLLFLDKKGHKARWVLGGIVSWGNPACGQPGKYSVFTNVARHINWITSKIEGT